MTKSALIQYIKFCIAQLSSSNGVFIFEHICRHFSRARISINIIPATGPVQAGGDQGRDFETFHSYLQKSPLNSRSFLGFIPNSAIVGACSLDKNPIKSQKIINDVKSILNGGGNVERIYFFSGVDIDVAKRHKTQDKVRDENGIELEIIDASALSEHLADKDLFWIAHEFLSVPIDAFPSIEEDNWYYELKKEFYNNPLTHFSVEAFVEIVRVLRHIYKNEELKHEIPFWLKTLEFFIQENIPRRTYRNAIYERFVVKIMAHNDVSGLEESILDFYSDQSEYISPQDLENSITLLSFVTSSIRLLGASFPNNFVKETKLTIEKNLSEIINNEESNICLKCSYLLAKSNFEFLLFDNQINIEKSKNNFCQVIKSIIELLPLTLYFPIQKLSDRVDGYIDLLIDLDEDTSELEQLARKIDSYLEKPSGLIKVAETKSARAIKFIQNEKYLKALPLLHEVKINWYNEGTLEQEIITTLLIAESYRTLNLLYASKYYAFTAAQLAESSRDDKLMKYFPQAIDMAASCDYLSGAWVSYLELLDIAVKTYHAIYKEFDFSEDKTSFHYLCVALIIFLSKKHNIKIEKISNNFTCNWGYLADDINNIILTLEDKNNHNDTQELLLNTREQIHGIYFNDLGSNRTICFCMYGIVFEVHFENNYHSNKVAEQIAAMLQIILSELKKIDIHNLKVPVEIQITTTQKEFTVTKKPSNKKSKWVVNCPSNLKDENSNRKSSQENYTHLVISIFIDISLLKTETILEIFDDNFWNENLMLKTSFLNTYEDLYQLFHDEEFFVSSQKFEIENCMTLLKTPQLENIYFEWDSSISKLLKEDESLVYIRNHINHLAPLSITLSSLNNNPEFIFTINRLRKDGFLDWQIYMALLLGVINYKLDFLGIIKNNQPKIHEFFSMDEKDWYTPITLDVVNYDNLSKSFMTIQMLTILPSYNLEISFKTPYLEQIKEVLKVKFKYQELGKKIKVWK